MEKAEEVIAEVYRQILQSRSMGIQPEKVIMMPSMWQNVEKYRRSLGIIDGPLPDYIMENSLFGLEIWYGSNPEIRVE